MPEQACRVRGLGLPWWENAAFPTTLLSADMPDERDLANDIVAQRGYLIRYASFHLRDAAQAEDAVQDTLAAALAQRGNFAGRAQLRTWLTAILKRKIVDQVRRREREVATDPFEGFNELDAASADAPFTAAGRWAVKPGNWNMPEAALEAAQFWRVFASCCKRMSVRHALVFSMREVMEMTSHDICRELGLSESNLHVMLFRARNSLRTCMTKNWFGTGRG